MKNLKVALLIATYNWPEALDLVLKSIKNQTVLPFEVIIADDGSTKETQDLINAFKLQLPVNLTHIWHEDKGFMKSQILNKAVANSNADYIIQVDGDCFLHTNFIEDHINNIKDNLYLYGTRVRIKKESVSKLLGSDKTNIVFFKSGIKKRMRNIRIPFISNFYKQNDTVSPKFRGCNFSFWKKDFIAINGYNEDFKGWGREDSELAIRFHNAGIKSKRLKFSGIVYHLDHHEENKDSFEKNDEIQENTIKNRLKICKNGIDKYL